MAIAIIMLISFSCILSYNIIVRNLGMKGLVWATEFSTYSNIWMVMLAGCTLSFDNNHICISGLQDHTRGAAQTVIRVFVQLMSAVFFAVCAVSSWQLVKSGMTQYVSTIRWLPMGYVYMVLPVGFILMILGNLSNVYFILAKKRQEEGTQ